MKTDLVLYSVDCTSTSEDKLLHVVALLMEHFDVLENPLGKSLMKRLIRFSLIFACKI